MRVLSRSWVAPSAATSWVIRAVVSRPETMPSTLRLAIRCLRCGSGECSVRSEGGGRSLPPSPLVRSYYLLRYSGPASAEELQDTLRALVGLSQHRGAGLGQDLRAREGDHLLRHVGVADAALRRGQVLDGDIHVVEGVLEPVLRRTELGTLARNGRDLSLDVLRLRGGDVQSRDAGGEVGGRRGGDVDLVAAVVADLERLRRAVEEVDTVELGVVLDPGDLGLELVELGRQSVLRVGALRAVGVLHRQVVHALEHGVDLGEGAFSGLGEGDAVLSVASADLEAADLRAQALGDGQPGRVVGRPVDAQTAGELLQ